MVNVLLTGLFGLIYENLTLHLVDIENHRYEHKKENSFINKFYMFQFVNNYVSFFDYIFYRQSFTELQYNLITYMVFKQVIFNLLEYVWLYCKVGRKIDKINDMFDIVEKKREVLDWKLLSKKEVKVAKADLRMHRIIERQGSYSKLDPHYVFYYNEAVI